MNQKFSGDIGQVAGRNVWSNSIQSTVSVHIHDGAKARYVTERQRAAIARLVFKIEAKTYTDKLMVYRRLMNEFGFPSMDTLPRGKYTHIIFYLDNWLRTGEAPQRISDPVFAARVRPESCPNNNARLARSNTKQLREPAFAQALPVQSAMLARKISWRIVVVVGGAIAVATTSTYIAIGQSRAMALAAVVTHAPLCEYGGSQYSIGSVVMQAGVRQRCDVAGNQYVVWQQANAGRQR
ncbi:alpha/beta hydrolase [Paraburkholderia bonniea]|uniref:alpha/beta hydrolase n=1 Tax=Paraburkholderia bonniea TaxID=2152891 RepID=UPI0012915E1F|nr:alpha/beta hydrolase [Paraburkholderia bonniea]WJF89459.1 alpha/beta hydrolase [Paraburkholderia bonniea]WJF92774.1 alpha/beta hydrolase [Paraburkholderia bonniea]